MRSIPLVASMLAIASVAAVDYTAEDITTKRANDNPSVQVVTTTTANSISPKYPFVRIAGYQNGGTLGYPALRLEAGQGSETTKAAVLGSQYLGGIEWQGFGTSIVTGAAMYGVADSTWTGTSTPARVGVFVNSGTALSEAMRIYPNGGVQIGGTYGTSPGAAALKVSGTVASTSSTSGALVVAGGVGVAGAAYIAGATNITNATASTATNNGALIVTGGIGVGGAINVGGASKITNTTASTSSTTGALTVSGGLGVAGASNFAGTLTTGSNFAVTGSSNGEMIKATLGTSSMTTLQDGVNQAYIMQQGSSTVQWGMGNELGTLAMGDYWALTRYNGGWSTKLKVTATDFFVVPSTRILNATASTSPTTGALMVTGGVGVAGAAFIGGLTNITNATASTATNNGALIVTGGVGVGGAINVGGASKITNTTASTSTTTGALTVAGGVGVAGGLNVGGDLTTTYGSTTWVKSTTQNTTTGTGAGASLEVLNNAGQLTKSVVATYSSTFASTVFGTTAANYSFFGGAGTSSAGMMIGNYLIDKPIILGINATEVARLTSGTLASGKVDIKYTTPSSSPATGALTVAGGVGVGGGLNVGGTVAVPVGAIIAGTDPGGYSRLRVGGDITVRDPVSASTDKRSFRISPYGQAGGERINIQALDDSGAFLRDIINLYHAGWVGIPGGLSVGGSFTASNGAAVNGSASISSSAAATDASHGALVVTGGIAAGGGYFNGGVQVKGSLNTVDATASNPANIIAITPGGSNGQRSAIRFDATFYNYPADKNPRRCADITAGYATGVWGTEYLSFNVGGASDAANLTTEQARITAAGQVLIGTKTPNSSAASNDLLQVNGGIYAKKLTVTTNGFPDYVFADTYHLKPLTDVEAFIKQHKHLPNVPSEADVVRDGISVDGMIKHQMEKIEELTLYAIAQDKELAAQRAAASAARREAAQAHLEAVQARQEVADLLKRIDAIERTVGTH